MDSPARSRLTPMLQESFEEKKQRAGKILRLLKKHYPDAKCSLNFKTPLELLVATQLSAQCTDKRVNIVTKSLFQKYKSARDYAKAPLKELQKDIKSTGFFRNKARHLRDACQALITQHKGRVPRDFAALTRLPGVGRKTAHVVMGNGFYIASGIVVDTHVGRLAGRMGFVGTVNVRKIETQLEVLVPKEQWIVFSHWLIEHGRKICSARKPLCKLCFLYKLCPKADLTEKSDSSVADNLRPAKKAKRLRS